MPGWGPSQAARTPWTRPPHLFSHTGCTAGGVQPWTPGYWPARATVAVASILGRTVAVASPGRLTACGLLLFPLRLALPVHSNLSQGFGTHSSVGPSCCPLGLWPPSAPTMCQAVAQAPRRASLGIGHEPLTRLQGKAPGPALGSRQLLLPLPVGPTLASWAWGASEPGVPL